PPPPPARACVPLVSGSLGSHLHPTSVTPEPPLVANGNNEIQIRLGIDEQSLLSAQDDAQLRSEALALLTAQLSKPAAQVRLNNLRSLL
ncbi:hypothetical protein T492DRAFT_898213, partial [Pavlovales sp. CCMP2436]